MLKATISNCSETTTVHTNIEKFIPRQILSGIKRNFMIEGKNVKKSTPTTTPAGVWAILTKGRIGETYWSVLTVEKNNRKCLEWSLKNGVNKRRLRQYDRPCWSWFALRHQIQPNCVKNWVGNTIHKLREAGLGDTIKCYRQPRLVEEAKKHEANYAKTQSFEIIKEVKWKTVGFFLFSENP